VKRIHLVAVLTMTSGLALGLELTPGITRVVASEESVQSQPKYALRLDEGEKLAGVNFQFTPKNGARRLSAATWSPPPGTKVPLHKHQRMEEYFFIHSGRGVLLINEQRIPFQAGTSLFVPQNTWHGFEFPDQEAVIYGVSSPPGLEEIFLAWSNPGLSKKQIAAVEQKHGLIWKEPKGSPSDSAPE
jgi:mannose-6-phosphate isomerase-like protein (cupin superfamily)